jgi:hypothetical protein
MYNIQPTGWDGSMRENVLNVMAVLADGTHPRRSSTLVELRARAIKKKEH